MKMGDGSDVPRVTCHRARQETRRIVNEMGDNHFNKLLRKLGSWGRTRDRCLGDNSTEQPLDFGCGPVQKSADEQLARYRSVSTTR